MLELKAILKSEIFKMPHQYGSSSDYRTSLAKTLTAFRHDLFNEQKKQKSVIPESIFARIETHINLINRALNNYYNGYPDEAYKVFKEYLDDLRPIPNVISKKILGRDNFLFRCRVADGKSFENEIKELFHVPFNLRSKIKNQRFSIAGVPSLYLSNSSYIAWEELRKPKLQDVYFAGMVLRLDTAFVDLRISEFCEKVNAQTRPDELINLCILFPLIFICSVQASNEQNAFTPEYILPQFTLRWTREIETFSGIIYDSAVVNRKSKGKFYNVVLPVLSQCEANITEPPICSILADKLYSTYPIKFQGILEKAEKTSLIPNAEIESVYIEEFESELHFSGSVFNKIDSVIIQTNTNIIE